MDWSNYYQAHNPYMGTAIGSAHSRQGANSQDAVRWADGNQFNSSSMTAATGRIIAGAVCDGVGSYGHSEVGAKICAAAACTVARDAALYQRRATPARVAAAVEKATEKALRQVAMMVGGGWEDFVHCTLLLLVCTPSWTAAWHCGDGAWAVNDAPLVMLDDLSAQPKPRTPAQAWEDHEAGHPLQGWLRPLFELPTREVKSAVIATDGARYLASGSLVIGDRTERDLDIMISNAAGLGTLKDDLGVFALRPIREGER